MFVRASSFPSVSPSITLREGHKRQSPWISIETFEDPEDISVWIEEDSHERNVGCNHVIGCIGVDQTRAFDWIT